MRDRDMYFMCISISRNTNKKLVRVVIYHGLEIVRRVNF